MRSSKVVGKPLGQHGANVYHREFHVTTEGFVKRYRLGEFYLVRKSKGYPVAVAEFQLIWKNAKTDEVSASVKLYVRPENSPTGRTEIHGKDELLEATRQFAIRGSDFPDWECSLDCWYAGSGELVYKDVSPDLVQRCLAPTTSPSDAGVGFKTLGGSPKSCAEMENCHGSCKEESFCTTLSNLSCHSEEEKCVNTPLNAQANSSNIAVDNRLTVSQECDKFICDGQNHFDEIRSDCNKYEDSEWSSSDIGSHSCVTVVSFSKYCRYMACVKLMQLGVYMPRPVLLMRGGIDTGNLKTLVLFSRWQTSLRDIDEFTLLAEVKPPIFSGRPRKRKVSAILDPQLKKQFRHAFDGAVRKMAYQRKWKALKELGLLNGEDNCRKDAYPQSQQAFVAELFHVMQELGCPIKRVPRIGAKKVDLYKLFSLIFSFGGYNRVSAYRQWRHVYRTLDFPVEMGGNGGYTLKKHYERLLYPYEKFVRDRAKGGAAKRLGKPRKDVSAAQERFLAPKSLAIADSSSTNAVGDPCRLTSIGDGHADKNCRSAVESTLSHLRRGREKPPPDHFNGDEIYQKRRGRPPNWLRRRLAMARDASLIAQLSASSGHTTSDHFSGPDTQSDKGALGDVRPEPGTAKFIVEKKRGRPTNELKQKLARARELYKTVEVQLPTTRDSRVPKWLRAFSEKSDAGGEIIVRKNRKRKRWRLDGGDFPRRSLSDADEPPTMSSAPRNFSDLAPATGQGRHLADDDAPMSELKVATSSPDAVGVASGVCPAAAGLSSPPGAPAKKRIDEIGRSLLKRASHVTEQLPSSSCAAVFGRDMEQIRGQSSPFRSGEEAWRYGPSHEIREASHPPIAYHSLLAASDSHIQNSGCRQRASSSSLSRTPPASMDARLNSLAYHGAFPERKFHSYKFIEHYPQDITAGSSGSAYRRRSNIAPDTGHMKAANSLAGPSSPRENVSNRVGLYYVPVNPSHHPQHDAYDHAMYERRRDVSYVFHAPPTSLFDDAYYSNAVGELPPRFVISPDVPSNFAGSDRRDVSPPRRGASSRAAGTPAAHRLVAAPEDYIRRHPHVSVAYRPLHAAQSAHSPTCSRSSALSSSAVQSMSSTGGRSSVPSFADDYYASRSRSRLRSPLHNGYPTDAWVARHPAGPDQGPERKFVHIPRQEPVCSTPCNI